MKQFQIYSLVALFSTSAYVASLHSLIKTNIEIIYDPWFIAIGSVVITLIIQPSLLYLVHKIRSQFGCFSGDYLVITKFSKSDQILIESIKCRHVGDSISGEIVSFCVANLNEGAVDSFSRLRSKYNLEGFVDGRVIVGSYKTKSKRQNSSGTLVLKADSGGSIFSGTSTGYEDMFVQTGDCYWLYNQTGLLSKTNEEIIKGLNKIYGAILLYTSREKLLNRLNEQWNIEYGNYSKAAQLPKAHLILGTRGIGKTSYIHSFVNNCLELDLTPGDWVFDLSSSFSKSNTFGTEEFNGQLKFNGLQKYERQILHQLIEAHEKECKDENQPTQYIEGSEQDKTDPPTNSKTPNS